MSRASNTGVRGLTVDHVPCPGACVYRAAGKRCPKDHPIYSLRFRRIDPERGPLTYTERMHDGTTLREATDRAAEASKAFADGKLLPRREQSRRATMAALDRKTVTEACEWYLAWAKIDRPRTHENRKLHCRQFCEFFGASTALTAITPEDVRRFRSHVQTGGDKRRSNGTVNRALATLWHLLTKAAGEGWISAAAVHEIRAIGKLEEAGTRERYLTAEEQGRLLAAMPADFRDFVLVALLTGMRLSEINGLRWSDLDFVARVVRLPKARTKQKHAHTIPMHDELEVLLSTRRRAAAVAAEKRGVTADEAGYVFPGEDGKPRARKAMTATFRRYAKKAGLAGRSESAPGAGDGVPRLRFHDIRHTVATRLTSADVPLGVVGDLLGHSDISTTRRYAHAEDATKRAAVARLRIVA